MVAWPWRRRDGGPPEVASAPAPLVSEVDPGDSKAELLTSLAGVIRFVNARSGRLPGPAVVLARRLTDTLGDIIDTAEDDEPLDVYTLLTVRGTLDDYLPTTLTTYLDVAPELRAAPRPSGDTPEQSLLAQIAALQKAASTVLVAVRNQDADALLTQGNFLRTKFAGSDLDLP